MDMSGSKISRLLLALVVIVVALGLITYKSGGLKLPQSANPASNSASSSVLVQSNKTPPTDEQKAAILNSPSQNASQDDKNNYFQLIAKFAQPTGKVAFTNCQPDPLILWVRLGDSYVITNQDNTAHTIQLDINHKYQLGANASQTVTANFDSSGEYGIFCDPVDGSKIVGVLHVTPK